MKPIAILALALALLGGLSTDVRAQKSGGGGGGSTGGGGNARRGGSYNLTFDKSGAAAGSRCTCLGGYNLTTYVTTLSLDYKINNSDLPDGTRVWATVLATDWYTGLPWLPLPGGAVAIVGGKASFHNANVVTTGTFGLPNVNQVVLTLDDGTVLFVGHP